MLKERGEKNLYTARISLHRPPMTMDFKSGQAFSLHQYREPFNGSSLYQVRLYVSAVCSVCPVLFCKTNRFQSSLFVRCLWTTSMLLTSNRFMGARVGQLWQRQRAVWTLQTRALCNVLQRLKKKKKKVQPVLCVDKTHQEVLLAYQATFGPVFWKYAGLEMRQRGRERERGWGFSCHLRHTTIRMVTHTHSHNFEQAFGSKRRMELHGF